MSDIKTQIIEEPILYILMRTDLPSLNHGKSVAQGAHAANAFVGQMTRNHKQYDNKLLQLYNNWSRQTEQDFGTTIVLGATETQIEKVISAVTDDHTNIARDYIYDPTYPYIVPTKELAVLISDKTSTAIPIHKEDGSVLMFRNEMTCAYVFGDKANIKYHQILDGLELHS